MKTHAFALLASLTILGILPAAGRTAAPRHQRHEQVDPAVAIARAFVKLQAHAVIIDPDGQQQEYRIGRRQKLRLDPFGAFLEVRFAPDRETIIAFMTELAGTYRESGSDMEVLGRAIRDAGPLDRFGALQVRGLVIRPDGTRERIAYGNARKDNPKQFAKRITDGAIMLTMRIAPGEAALLLLDRSPGSAAPETRVPDAKPKKAARKKSPDTAKPKKAQRKKSPGAGKAPKAPRKQSPDAAKPPHQAKPPIEQALLSPEALDLIGKGLQDPGVQRLLQQGLQSPKARKAAEQALRNDAARDFLGQLLKELPKEPAKGAKH